MREVNKKLKETDEKGLRQKLEGEFKLRNMNESEFGMKYSRGGCTNESKERSDCYPCSQFCAGFMLDCMFAMYALFEQLWVH